MQLVGGSLDAEVRSLALQMTLKIADLSHLTAPFAGHRVWVDRLSDEFFAQARTASASASLTLNTTTRCKFLSSCVLWDTCQWTSIHSTNLFRIRIHLSVHWPVQGNQKRAALVVDDGPHRTLSH